MGAAKRKAKRKAKLAAQGSRAYEAAMSIPSRRRVIGADQSQDSAAQQALGAVRDWGRYLDENHDLAAGVLDELVKNIVGTGIETIAKPLNADGSVNDSLAKQITPAWREWTRTADVTGELSWADAQRLICRAWLRDGEEFIQHVGGIRGEIAYPFRVDEVPYRVELLESEMVPWELTDDTWRQGIRHNAWRMPVEYAVHKEHPGDVMVGGRGYVAVTDYKVLNARNITHIKLAKRWPATRGMSIFASVISRLYDVKDLEESERIKNRVLASWTAAITRSPDMPGFENATDLGTRHIGMAGGTIIDDLAPGESIDGVGPEYPVANMPEYIGDQIRRVASGTGTRYSSISKRYDGNYAAQRQEMVESEGHYQMREDAFVSKICRPIYERWLAMAILDGKVSIGVVPFRMAANAEYRGPVTPWIDPLKEVQADKLAEEAGFITLEQVQIKRGASQEIIGKRPARPNPPAAPRPAEEDAA